MENIVGIIWLVLWIIICIATTAIIEELIAIGLGYTDKKQRRFVFIVNIAMRVILIAWICFTIISAAPDVNGLVIFVMLIFGAPIEMFIEMILYAIFLDKLADDLRDILHVVRYVIVSNIASYIATYHLILLMGITALLPISIINHIK